MENDERPLRTEKVRMRLGFEICLSGKEVERHLVSEVFVEERQWRW